VKAATATTVHRQHRTRVTPTASTMNHPGHNRRTSYPTELKHQP